MLAPVPIFGMFVDHALRRNFIFRASAAFLRVDVGDYSARLVDTKAVLHLFFDHRFGVEFGINATQMSYADQGGQPFAVDYSQTGILGAVNIVF